MGCLELQIRQATEQARQPFDAGTMLVYDQ
jgi:hypothetical protein